jgi:predicted amidohydrolase
LKRVAAIQMASGPNVNANLLEAQRLIDQAVNAGAGLVVLPENFAQMGKESDKLKIQEQPGDGLLQRFLAEQAKQHKIWIVGGTIPIATGNPNKVFASSLLFDDQGKQVARYDKIHLFDVHLSESNENYTESQTIESGHDVVVVETPFGKLGMAICYDLRFPGLFRRMLDEGVNIISLPSAFTALTGKAHWDILVRARAIENLSFVVAAAQGGFHVNGRETHGDSMIVDPWGTVLDRKLRGSGVAVADIDLARQREIRINFPVLEHRKIACRLPD